MKQSVKNGFSRLRSWQAKSRFGSLIFAIPFFLSLFGLDTAFRFIYRSFGVTRFLDIVPFGFTIGWCLVLVGIACLLPGRARRAYMIIISVFFNAIVLADGIMVNMFRRFFSFSDLSFAGDGAAFLELSYLLLIRKLTVLVVLVCLLLTAAACVLTPGKGQKCVHGFSSRVITGAVSVVLGVLCVIGVRVYAVGEPEPVIWSYSESKATIYESTSDTKSTMILCGLYHYTFRDLWNTISPYNGASAADVEALDEYFASKNLDSENEMTGIFEGKNLLMIQLEAIDTWMLTPEIMPKLYEVKQESFVFNNHFSAAYITAGTFNTEFIAQTGLLPALPGVSTSIYTNNDFSKSIASVAEDAGYTSRSFHGSGPEIYNRGAIHENLGFEKYYSGADMGLDNFMLDRQLNYAFDLFTEGDPFYSFIITYSGHGPYEMTNGISQTHWEEAQAIADIDNEQYIHAVAHALETELFIDGLFEKLKETGLYDNTVVVFFADHYNYYCTDNELIKELKNESDPNLLQHTDFFIWSSDIEHREIDKVTSTLDILPTVLNLMGFDADLSVYSGNDAFGPNGGYVFFSDMTWYDGEIYYNAYSEITDYTKKINNEIADVRKYGQMVLSTDYYAFR